MPDEPQAPQRGWLKNGNPPGDFTKARQCGAKTRRAAPCQSPAMRNGRCRMQGGTSTGPRTSAGLERSRNRARKSAEQAAAAIAKLLTMDELAQLRPLTLFVYVIGQVDESRSQQLTKVSHVVLPCERTAGQRDEWRWLQRPTTLNQPTSMTRLNPRNERDDGEGSPADARATRGQPVLSARP
jgi:hypothetical protein